MVSFNSLPNELVLQIIRLLLPDDLESFSSTGRLAYKLAGSSLEEHRELKRKYRFWCSDVRAPSDSCLYVLLRAILKNPRIALYVETLPVGNVYEERMSDAGDVETKPYFSRTGVMTDDEQARFIKAIRECRYVSADESEGWSHSLENGYDDPTLALLVTLLPNLERLDIEVTAPCIPLFFETIRRISTTSSTLDPSRPLSRLSEAVVGFTKLVDESPIKAIDIGCLWPFFALPSMRFVCGEGVCHSELILLPERSSDVRRLAWVDPYDLTPEKTKKLFRPFRFSVCNPEL